MVAWKAVLKSPTVCLLLKAWWAALKTGWNIFKVFQASWCCGSRERGSSELNAFIQSTRHLCSSGAFNVPILWAVMLRQGGAAGSNPPHFLALKIWGYT